MPSAAKVWQIPQEAAFPSPPLEARSTPLEVQATSYLAASVNIFSLSNIFIGNIIPFDSSYYNRKIRSCQEVKQEKTEKYFRKVRKYIQKFPVCIFGEKTNTESLFWFSTNRRELSEKKKQKQINQQAGEDFAPENGDAQILTEPTACNAGETGGQQGQK